MKKYVIFYFSGTGNTKWAADKIKKRLEKAGIDTRAISIDTLDNKKASWHLKTADLIGFGYPIYGSDLPEPMKIFIDALPNVNYERDTFVFCTQMMFSGDGAWVYNKQIQKKALNITNAQHINMPNNICVSGIPLKAPLPDKHKKILQKAEQTINTFCESIIKRKINIRGKNSYLLGLLQRVPYRLFKKHLKNLFSVDKQKCNGCERCAKLCPMNNIEMIEEKPVFKKNCILCQRCYNFCPQKAILFMKKPHKTNKKGEPYTGPDKKFKPEQLI